MPPKDLPQPSPEDAQLPSQLDENEEFGSYLALDDSRRNYFSSQGIDVVRELQRGNVTVVGTIDLDDEARKKLPEPIKGFANSVYERDVELQRITIRSGRHETFSLAGPPAEITEDFLLEVTPRQSISEAEQRKREKGFTGILVPSKDAVRDGWFRISMFNYPIPASQAFVPEYGLDEWLGLSDVQQENKGAGTRVGTVKPELEQALANVIADQTIGFRAATIQR